MDKTSGLCYNTTMILTLSVCRHGCVKGALQGIRRGKIPGPICRCRTGQRLIIFCGNKEKTSLLPW